MKQQLEQTPPRTRLEQCMAAFCVLCLVLSCGSEVAGRGGSLGPVLAAPVGDEVVFSQLGEFALINQRGEAVTLASLSGRPWVMGAIFTTCSTLCPRMTAAMAEIAEQVDPEQVRLVSISVDPDFDSPEVLSEYAQKIDAGPNWLFLTGEQAEVTRVVQKGFLQAVARSDDPNVNPGERVTHDSKLVAVDHLGRVRGYYESSDSDEMELLVERLEELAQLANAER